MTATKLKHRNLPSGTLRISIVNICNMNCFYCHNEGQDKIKTSMMSFRNFKKILDTSLFFGLRGVTFSGGEPFLNKDLCNMIKYCHKIGLKKIDICTNGILIKENLKLLKISKNIELAVGIDTIDKNKISKNSSVGKNFEYICNNLDLLKKEKIKFSINSVYNGSNLSEMIKICEFCGKNNVNIRIIEMDTFNFLTKSIVTSSFKKCIDSIAKKFKLKLRRDRQKGYYGILKNGSKIYFYDSYCHNRDCFNCARWTLRINSNGEAIPCYARNFKINLLRKNKDDRYNNFLKAIYNTGIPPEKIKS